MNLYVCPAPYVITPLFLPAQQSNEGKGGVALDNTGENGSCHQGHHTGARWWTLARQLLHPVVEDVNYGHGSTN